MIGRTRAVIEAHGRLSELRSEPPMTLRRVYSEDDELCALCLVGTAAGPLPGDDLLLDLDLRARARAVLTATGATIAQGRAGSAASTVRTVVRVDGGASLQGDPGPLIVCEGSRVDAAVCIELTVGAALLWREVIVLGRAGAPAGAVTLRWDVRLGGRPLLRQFLDLSDPMNTSPSVLGGAKVIASLLMVSPHIDARTVVQSAREVGQQLSEHAVMLTVLAGDAATAKDKINRLLERYARWPGADRRDRPKADLRPRST